MESETKQFESLPWVVEWTFDGANILGNDGDHVAQVFGSAANEESARERAWSIISAVNSSQAAQGLATALENLAYFVARIAPPPYDHKCHWCAVCTAKVTQEARAALKAWEDTKP